MAIAHRPRRDGTRAADAGRHARRGIRAAEQSLCRRLPGCGEPYPGRPGDPPGRRGGLAHRRAGHRDPRCRRGCRRGAAGAAGWRWQYGPSDCASLPRRRGPGAGHKRARAAGSRDVAYRGDGFLSSLHVVLEDGTELRVSQPSQGAGATLSRGPRRARCWLAWDADAPVVLPRMTPAPCAGSRWCCRCPLDGRLLPGAVSAILLTIASRRGDGGPCRLMRPRPLRPGTGRKWGNSSPSPSGELRAASIEDFFYLDALLPAASRVAAISGVLLPAARLPDGALAIARV